MDPEKRGLTPVIRAGVVTAALLCAGFLAGLLGAPRLVRNSERADSIPADSAAVVIALSSSVGSDAVLDQIGTDRLRAAIRIVRDLPRAQLITSRVRAGNGGPASDADQRRQVVQAGLEGRWTVLDGLTRSTRDEATRLRSLLPDSVAAVIVVTSAAHTRRACATFERVGFRVACRPARGRDETGRSRLLYDYLYERAATLKYRRRGWIR